MLNLWYTSLTCCKLFVLMRSILFLLLGDRHGLNMFGEKHMPSQSRLYLFSTTLDEYRKCTYPLSAMNPTSTLLGVGFAALNPLMNIGFMNKPAMAGGHRTVALGMFGIWTGYYLLRGYEQYYFGRFKYCLDYALMRKDIFTKKAPMKYGDPGILDHWKPIR